MIRYFWFCLLLLVSLETSAAVASAVSTATEESNLLVNNRKLAVFRCELGGYSAQDRARAAVIRVEKALAEKSAGILSRKETDQGTMLELDGRSMFTLRACDIHDLAGEDKAGVIARAVQQIKWLVEEYDLLRNPRRLLIASAEALLATLLLYGAIRVLMALRCRLHIVVKRRAEQLLAKLAADDEGSPLLQASKPMLWLLNTTTSLCVVLASYAWASVVLALFPYTRPWAEQLNQTALAFLSSVLTAVLNAVPGLLITGFILYVAFKLHRLLRIIFDRLSTASTAEAAWLDRDTAPTTRKILTFLIWMLALAMIYPHLPGAGTDAFKGLSVMFGLMVSLGASGIVGQFASGLILIYSKSLKVGEYVATGHTEGTVVHIGLFTTKIHTNLREEVSIPNSVLVGQDVKNFSRLATDSGVISVLTLTVGYDTPWRQVEAMLLVAADGVAGVRATPAPKVYQSALSDFYVEYQLRVAVDDPRRRLEIMTELHCKVQDQFNLHGVQIMSPHYRADPQDAKIVPPENWYLAPAKKPPAQD